MHYSIASRCRLLVQALFSDSYSFCSPEPVNDLIDTDWFRDVATYNPFSYLIEGMRSLVISGWDGEALALGFGCAIGIAVLTFAAAAGSLRTRLTRT